jgi:hypothetical protein
MKASRLTELLLEGGDQRLELAPNLKRNSYGCSPFPRQDLTYSSSTASSISEEAWAYLTRTWSKQDPVDLEPEKAQEVCEQSRYFIKRCFSLPQECSVIFGPSGTDLELVVSYLSLSPQGRLTNIFFAADEVGSGTLRAGSGCYFSNITPSGDQVDVGSAVTGFDQFSIEIYAPQLRCLATGRLLDIDYEHLDSFISDRVEKNGRVLLHLVYRSKTGVITPDVDNIVALKSKWGKSLNIVVDCCQMRVTSEKINYFLENDFMVLITGSKFYSGPPFSAALLVKDDTCLEVVDNFAPPLGFSQFFSRFDFPEKLIKLRESGFPNPNWGLILRWQAAIFEIKEFYDLDRQYFHDYFIEFYLAYSALVDQSPYTENFSDITPQMGDLENSFSTTVNTFFIKNRFRYLSESEVRMIYHLMTRNCSDIHSDQDYKDILSSCCHLGQPVRVKENDSYVLGTLRISISSRLIVRRSNKYSGLTFYDELGVIFKKLAIIIDHYFYN